jgi:hypothetical protein
MSKKYKGKTCVYCCIPGSSQVGDHVVAREFFPISKRVGLPVVPACDACNNTKSALELYATSLIPFGATHPEATSELLRTAKRLARNLKLARSMDAGRNYRFVSRDGVNWEAEMTVPLKPDDLERLYGYIARGLAFSYWQVLLPDDECLVFPTFFTSQFRTVFDHVFKTTGGVQTGEINLGDGIFVYSGVRDPHIPRLTIWRMSLCGAVMADHEAAGEKVSLCYVITAPRNLTAIVELVEKIKASGTRD